VVTRAPEQSAELTRALEALGADVIAFPMVSVVPPKDSRELDEQLRRLDEFDAILFLSGNAVKYTFDRCAQLGIECDLLSSGNRLVAAVGPATARPLAEKGIRVAHIAEKGTGEALVRELRDSLTGRRILIPRSDRGDERVPSLLKDLGANVTEVVAYRTAAPASVDAAVRDRIRRAEIDAVIFASPSAFRNFVSAVGPAEAVALGARVVFVAIGPTTARSIREAGARVAAQSESASAADLARAVAAHCPDHPEAARRA